MKSKLMLERNLLREKTNLLQNPLKIIVKEMLKYKTHKNLVLFITKKENLRRLVLTVSSSHLTNIVSYINNGEEMLNSETMMMNLAANSQMENLMKTMILL